MIFTIKSPILYFQCGINKHTSYKVQVLELSLAMACLAEVGVTLDTESNDSLLPRSVVCCFRFFMLQYVKIILVIA